MSRIPNLDPRFGKLIALMESSTHEAERDTARQKAEALLPPEAGGFDRALRILAYERARAAAPKNMFAGFDEHYEIDNPGHMAREAAKRAEKQREDDERRAELVAEFGSLEAVLKPCKREKALMAAVKPWREPCKRPHQRWTSEIAGLSLYDDNKASAEVLAAIDQAYPMPLTYAEAKAEAAYWDRRNDDMELAQHRNCGDYGLDQVAVWRWRRVRRLVEHEMPLRTLPDIIDRMRSYRSNEGGTDTDVEDAILRDLEALAARSTQTVLLDLGMVSREELLRQAGEQLRDLEALATRETA